MGYARWKDIRAEHVERAGDEEAVEAGKRELLATVRGYRLAEIRRTVASPSNSSPTGSV
ncbi:hypothetical protein [Amycolatopsis alkalitolerans]|uniref:hypothetical protein n=1 Tax=Amycolatopsis alkalitolerans TaxID=2547244 RepID=UPI00190F9620|nr:hypothetical protein [Amycolatopsis alkalitolerans]